MRLDTVSRTLDTAQDNAPSTWRFLRGFDVHRCFDFSMWASDPHSVLIAYPPRICQEKR